MLSLDLIRECGLPGRAKGPVSWQGDRTRPKWRWILILSTSHLSGELTLLIVCINLHLLRDDCASNCPLSCTSTIKALLLYISLFAFFFFFAPLEGNSQQDNMGYSYLGCKWNAKMCVNRSACAVANLVGLEHLAKLVVMKCIVTSPDSCCATFP